MDKAFSRRWLAIIVGIAMIAVLATACGETKTIEVPGETIVVEKEVVREVEVPGETIVVEKEVVKQVEVAGKTVEVEVAGPERVVTKEVVVKGEEDRWIKNIFGENVERPQYGGTLPVAIQLGVGGFDIHNAEGNQTSFWGTMVYDQLGTIDWSLSRDTAPYLTSRFVDLPHMTGNVAESWTIDQDAKKYTFKIRKGIYWHDKAPMNGRELTNKDVEWNFHRMLGMGKFEEPATMAHGIISMGITGAEAVGSDGFEVEVDSFDFGQIMVLLRNVPGSLMSAPEVGDGPGFEDWENIVGTGPYELVDFVPGSQFTFDRNPNYWRHDPYYPELKNPLPYTDRLEQYVIRDKAALAAALRTGKIAFTGGKLLTLDIIDNILETNPDIVARPLIGPNPGPPQMYGDGPPYNDKNVRVAMQKAINRDEINNIYYGGKATAKPFGYVTSFATGMWFPFDDLSDEVKWQYEFDPAEAEKLLDAAGYPRGDDGIRFSHKYEVVPQWLEDPDLAQLVTTYWADIGVDVEVVVEADESVYWNDIVDGNVEKMTGGSIRHAQWYPIPAIKEGFVGCGAAEGAYFTGLCDEEWNAHYAKIEAATDRDEYMALVKEMDKMFFEKHFNISVVAVPLYQLHQPWVKNYKGELGGAMEQYVSYAPYIWVDKELKDAMGH